MSQLGLFGRPQDAPSLAPSAPSAPPVPESPRTFSRRENAPTPPTPATAKWVICPSRITGSMDAEDVTPDGWEEPARAMAARERLEVCLYLIETNGAWTLRRRMGADGAVRA